jgi:hypothetical protein
VNIGVGDNNAVRAQSVGSALRGAGRIVLWAAIGLLLVRGLISVASGPGAGDSAPARGGGVGPAEEAFAIRFARAYLADPTAPALRVLLAEGAQLGIGRRPRAGGEVVAQAEVSTVQKLGGGRSVLTVACELRDSRTLYLAVPIARTEAGEVAALGAPSLVAAPKAAGVKAQRPRPLAGGDARQIAALVRRFLSSYVEAGSAGELAYFLAPGAFAAPLGGSVRFLSVVAIGQAGPGEGPRRTVIARIRVEDLASGAIYPLAYRLALVRLSRWYVAELQGVAS